jgi:hypothetical protein
MADYLRLANTTINKYIRDVEVNVLRNRKLLALMKQHGRISFDHSGLLLDWKVRYKRAPIQGFADGDTLTFPKQERWKTAQIDWRGYAAVDSMNKMERLKNKNAEAIVKVWSEAATLLMEDMEERFGDELYIDGNATGNSKRMHGVESFFGTSSAGTKQPVGVPSDSYAGLLTDLGNYGGSWTATGTTTQNPPNDWPAGFGDEHYDFWTPLIVDYTSAITTNSGNGTLGWTAATKTWANTAREALRYGIIRGQKNKSKKGMLDLVTLEGELWREFLDLVDTHEHLTIQRGDGLGLWNLGFKDVINFDGAEVTWEYGIPLATGYGWSMQNLELCSLQKQLFGTEGPDMDISTQSTRLSIDFFGNMRFNPRCFTKWKNVS